MMRSKIINILFFWALFTSCTRGLFELVIDKNICYLFQAGFWMLFVLGSFFLSKKVTKTPYFYLGSLLLITLLVVISFSSLATVIINKQTSFWVYSFVTFYFAFLMFSSSSLKLDAVSNIHFGFYFSVMTWILFIAATLQQVGVVQLPGTTDVFYLVDSLRPSSLTGSYLHYPIVLALFGFLLFEIAKQKKNKFYFLTSMVAFLGVFTSFSRSGSMIVIFGFILYFLKLKNIKSKKGFLALGVLFFAGIAAVIYSNEISYVERILSSIDLAAPGNTGRLNSWIHGLDMWFDSPLLIGSYTGMVTNVSRNFEVGESYVVESGLIQQLLNFGLFGALVFYALFFAILMRTEKKHQWLRVAVIAGICESFVYQSIEVFPFMTVLSIFPFVSFYLSEEISKINLKNNYFSKKIIL